MGQKRKVLLVEDDSDLSFIIEHKLTSNGFIVCGAGKGAEALSAFESFSPDIVIVDRLLPDMDGLDIVSHIRDVNARIPILIHSVMSDINDVLRGFECGADDYIRKPCEMDELLARVKTHLKCAEQHSGTTSCMIGDFELDYDARVLSFKGEAIRIQNMELILLKVLADNTDQFVSFSRLIYAMWNDCYYPSNNNVHVYVSHLRTILSRDKRVNIINRRSIGYKLVVK